MADRFAAKVGVVTGGAQGIGESIARRLIAEGGSVVVGDLNIERLAALADELGDRFVGVSTDVTSEKDLEALVAAAVDNFGALDLAVNVAGAAKYKQITELTEEEWDFTLDICAKGVVFSVKHEARQMLAQGGGAIVNIASLNATVPMVSGAPYCAAKAAVAMVSQVAALELGAHGIRVNAVSPGLTATPLNAELRAAPVLHDAFLERIPLGRSASPDEIAAAALWLASDDAAYVTGTNLLIDGGWAQTTYPDLRRILSQAAG